MSRRTLLLVPALLGLLACGSGGGSSTPAPAPPPPPPPPAPKLAYADPAGGDYRLLRNAALSTDGHLVMDLVGPSGAQGRGLAFTLTVDGTRAAWAKPQASDPDPAVPATFDLGVAPRILKVKVNGAVLRAAWAQKGDAVAPKALNAPLGRVALDLLPAAPAGAAAFTASEAQVLPASGAPQGITLTVGTLQVQ